jgi:hypothetical protein
VSPHVGVGYSGFTIVDFASSYSDKQMYSGHWMHNVRHGHGVLRMGTLTSPSPSIFTGNWDNDKRSGFGVMDDIMR